MYLACPDLTAAFASGSTIVTPNRLLSSVAAEQFTQTQLQSGLTAWRSPLILSVGAWLADSWQQARYAGAEVPALLSPAQERAVWQDLIEAEHPALFDYTGAVGLAIAASRMLAEWQIPSEGDSWATAPDTLHFQRLHRQFRRRAERQGWIVRADLWRLIPDWVGQPWWHTKQLTFVAFPAVTPALQVILHRLQSRARLASLQPNTPKKSVPLFECPDFHQELEFAARWARHQHEINPEASIALFLPNLSAHRQQIQRTLRQVFYSGQGLQPANAESVFHLHVSQPLLHHPLIESALLLIELAQPRIAVTDAGTILRLPFVAGAEAERHERALADANLRRHRDLDVSLYDVERASSRCHVLGRIWSNLRPLLEQNSGVQDLPAWSEFIANLLSAAGWPGDFPLTADEQNIVEDWKAALSDLAALGYVSQTHLARSVLLPAALAHLRSILNARTLQTGDLSSPIQVLDATSAYGLQFESAAIVGLSADAWPTPLRPSPFIPIQLQRPMLASTMAFRSHSTAALFATATTLIATHSGDLASAARLYTKRRRNDLAIWSAVLPLQSAPALALGDYLDDSQAPAFQLSGSTAAGGVSILKSQSQCPFQAFAKYRLAARRPEDACFGFDARERGSFLHRALEHVWAQLQTRDRLKSTSQDDRRALIHHSARAAVGEQSGSLFRQLAGQAECDRLEEVIMEWLTVEERRDQPFTVEHIEKDQSLQISGLPINLRIDRIDRLRDGSAVLIDYKSGEPKLKGLEGERPSEPQLLVYAAALNEPVEGLFFAQLKPRNLKAVGWSRSTQFPVKGRSKKNTHPDWDGFLRRSSEAVQNIAAEFVSGWAAVDPQPGACTFCNLKPLCRVNEHDRSGEESDDAD